MDVSKAKTNFPYMDLSLLHVFKQQYTNTEWHNYYKSKLTILYVRRFGMGLEIDEMVS